MDVIEFAMQMELDGKAFYEKGAAGTDDPKMKKIFSTLAEEEHRHYHVFRKLIAGEATDASDLAPKGSTVAMIKNIFREMIDAGKDQLEGDTIKALWTEAVEVEKKSEKMYREAAESESDPTRKEMLNRTADEEKNHIYLIDNMISFLADPEAFMASQNYGNFMSWEGH